MKMDRLLPESKCLVVLIYRGASACEIGFEQQPGEICPENSQWFLCVISARRGGRRGGD
jgi:hypothetical protein